MPNGCRVEELSDVQKRQCRPAFVDQDLIQHWSGLLCNELGTSFRRNDVLSCPDAILTLQSVRY